MKNKNIVFLVSFLTPLMLSLEKSSARRRFIRHLSGFVDDSNIEGEDIRKEFSDKNEDKTPKIINKIYQFTKENRKKADEKFKVLNNLVVEIDWTGEEKDKDVVVELLNEKLTEIKKSEKFDDETFSYIEQMEEIISELN